ncbi:MAG: ribonuclease III [Oscillospiraceae bacterium]|jgi:ribonuclease-3 family protein|nr:ribonuclease III [Oscillospiraceae bacterium]
MKNYFSPEMSDGEIQNISCLGLAHMGDAVFELLVRSEMCSEGRETQTGMHKAAVSMVNASAQAAFAGILFEKLSDEERDVFRRARNAKVHSAPKSSDLGSYHSATALEALFGWLFLKGRLGRINELFDEIMKHIVKEGGV